MLRNRENRNCKFVDITLLTILNLTILPTPFSFFLDMEAVMESVGDVRCHSSHRGHQAPGRWSCKQKPAEWIGPPDGDRSQDPSQYLIWCLLFISLFSWQIFKMFDFWGAIWISINLTCQSAVQFSSVNSSCFPSKVSHKILYISLWSCWWSEEKWLYLTYYPVQGAPLWF